MIWYRHIRTQTAHAFVTRYADSSVCLKMDYEAMGAKSILASKRCKMCIKALARQKKGQK